MQPTQINYPKIFQKYQNLIKYFIGTNVATMLHYERCNTSIK